MEQSIGFAHFLGQTDAVGKAILGILLLMSMVSWYFILTKAIAALLERRRSARFVDTFWDASSITAVQRHLEQQHPDEPFSHAFNVTADNAVDLGLAGVEVLGYWGYVPTAEQLEVDAYALAQEARFPDGRAGRVLWPRR